MIIKEARFSNQITGKIYRFFSRRMLLFLLVFLILIIAGLFFVSRKYRDKIHEKGFSGPADFITTVSSNYLSGLFSKTPDMVIDMKHRHFQEIAWRRQKALDRGLIVNEEGSWVPATITFQGKTVKVEMRLKGHMTDHIQGDKWSFRIKVEDKGDIAGMRRLTIQHPGTRGYVNEWVYHQLQKGEGVMALRYDFIDVTLNGKDLGIYALEENFDEELVQNNQRPPGPLMRFDPSIYWEYRLREHEGRNAEHDYAEYSSTVLEPYRFEKVLEDPGQKRNFLAALDLMEGFRKGALNTSQVFDTKLLADFHAIIDLVGGHHSLDWSDVKFYYNPATGKLEPVAYESFGIQPTWRLSGAGNFKPGNPGSYHQRLFSDTAFFEQYIQSVEKISSPQYLDSFFQRNDSALSQKLASVYREFPYQKFQYNLYRENQKRMQDFLHIPSAVRAFVSDSSELFAGSVSALPLQLISIGRGKTEINIPGNKILLPKVPGEPVNLERIDVPGLFLSKFEGEEIWIRYRVTGSSQIDSAMVRPHRISEEPALPASSDLNQPFLLVDSSLKRLTIIPGEWTFKKDFVVPAGWLLHAGPGVRIKLKDVQLISSSPLSFRGNEENPVEVVLSGNGSIRLAHTDGNNVFTDVLFRNEGSVNAKNAAINLYNGNLSVNRIMLIGIGEGIRLNKSIFNIGQLSVDSCSGTVLKIDHSEGKINGSRFYNCIESAIQSRFSTILVSNNVFTRIGKNAIKAGAVSNINGSGNVIRFAETAVLSLDEATVNLENLLIENCKFGLVTKSDLKRFNAGVIIAGQTTFRQVENETKAGPSGVLRLNGKLISSEP